MRVHLYGNTLNNAVVVGRLLQNSGCDVQVFIPCDDRIAEQDRPEWEYGDMLDQIEGMLVRVPPPRPFRPAHFAFLNAFVKADILHVFGEGPALLSANLRKLPPAVFQSFGGDLQILPWQTWPLRERVYAAMQRVGIRRCRHAIIMPYQHALLKRLGFSGAVTDDLPFMADYAHMRSVPRHSWVSDRFGNYKLLVYFPSRHVYTQDIGPYAKNNYVGLLGFSRFVREHRVTPEDVRLVIVNKGVRFHESLSLIEREGIRPYVDILEEHPRAAVYSFMSLSQVVVLDQFPDLPEMTFGGIAREALFHGAPVVVKTDVRAICRMYQSNDLPILHASDAGEVAFQLGQMLNERRRLAQRNTVKAWADRYLNNDRLVSRLTQIYRDVLEAHNSDD